MKKSENNNNESIDIPALTPLEASIQARVHTLNFPALQAMFELTEAELQAILDKLPPTEDCNC